MDTLFTKIINREIPAKIIYEDDQVLAFHDIAPQAPVHFLVIPKKPVRTLNDLTEDDKALAGHILFTAQRLALELGCEEGQGYLYGRPMPMADAMLSALEMPGDHRLNFAQTWHGDGFKPFFCDTAIQRDAILPKRPPRDHA